jgi:hypothetical protein
LSEVQSDTGEDSGFDEKALLEEARRATGLDDFGPHDFREGLGVLIRTIETNPFTEKGRKRNRLRLIQLLSTRLRIQEAFRRHPEILERELVRPMFLTGLPRSGTSALFNLLAADPAARPLLLWETQFPDPAEGLAPGQTDPRYLAVKAYTDQMREKNPEFTKVHYASADTPEECVLIHAYAFDGGMLGFEMMLEPYGSWLRKHDFRPLYRYYADILRLLDWQRPGERWLLKTPAHLWALDALVETFPDCCIVWNHRDPVVCVASISSMTHMIMGEQVDMTARELGPRCLDCYAASMARGLELRAGLDPARFVDVDYAALVADNMGAVRSIYEHFDLPLGTEARAAMEAHAASHPQGRHGRHEYDITDFGITAEEVRGRFASYLEQHDLGSS